MPPRQEALPDYYLPRRNPPSSIGGPQPELLPSKGSLRSLDVGHVGQGHVGQEVLGPSGPSSMDLGGPDHLEARARPGAQAQLGGRGRSPATRRAQPRVYESQVRLQPLQREREQYAPSIAIGNRQGYSQHGQHGTGLSAAGSHVLNIGGGNRQVPAF